ncbi:MAG: 50S ribosomal protein L13, partial [Candidatus Omnitrophica bacterium]|nr:50S ribosomal protein L13 [Candidatus Omnitrophota bacterium]
ILKGKTKSGYTPNVDCGDFVVVINASQIKVTGNKLTQRVYRRYSGYPGGLREVRMDVMLARKPETVIKLAVKRMLPYGPLARRLIKKLKVYAADKHPHSAQQPEVIKL